MKIWISFFLLSFGPSIEAKQERVMFNAFDSCRPWKPHQTAQFLKNIDDSGEKFEFARANGAVFLREPLARSGLLGNYYAIYYESENSCRESRFFWVKLSLSRLGDSKDQNRLFLASDLPTTCQLPSKPASVVKAIRVSMLESFTKSRHCYIKLGKKFDTSVETIVCDGDEIEFWSHSHQDCERLSKRLRD